MLILPSNSLYIIKINCQVVFTIIATQKKMVIFVQNNYNIPKKLTLMHIFYKNYFFSKKAFIKSIFVL